MTQPAVPPSTLPRRTGDLDPNDPDLARRVISERFIQDPEVRKVVLRYMAGLLELCREHPERWGMTLNLTYVSLNTGPILALRYRKGGRVQIALDEDALSPEAAARRHELGISNRHTPSLPGVCLVTMQTEPLAENLELFREANEAAVRKALNSRSGRITWWDRHSEGVLRFLEKELDREVPYPDYTLSMKGKRYWKIATGKQGSLWEASRRGGYISVGWPLLGDLRRFETKEEFEKARAEIESKDPKYSRYSAGQAWTFRHLNPGDRVIANKGMSEILGVGTVLGPYQYLEDEEAHPHRFPIRWDDTTVRPVNQPGWRRTLIELGRRPFEKLIGAEQSDDAEEAADPSTERKKSEVGEPRGFQALVERISEQGLYFSTETLANVLLALQTKRFLILTGISGTGKTRIAQEIARHFRPQVDVTEIPADAVRVETYPYMIKRRGMILPREILDLLELPEFGATNSALVKVAYPGGVETVRLWKNPDRPVARLPFTGDLGKWMLEHFVVGEDFWMKAPGETADDTSSPDEAGSPSRNDEEQVFLRLGLPWRAQRRQELNNYSLVPVRPDWTDHRGLLGHYNPLTEQYMSTSFLDALLRAASEERNAEAEGRSPHAFFLILDEMNLARVEHYFSDFLSSLESGEPFDLHDVEAIAEGASGGVRSIPKQLKIPKNVFFIGTVNVDESTYMFSPKVLDRAFTIEFNDVDLLSSGGLQEAPETTELYLTGLPEELVWRESPGPEHWRRLCRSDRDLAESLMELNDILRKENRHFGYRVANEIARFLLLAIEQAGGEAGTAALDLAVLQKILPKLHGTQQELDALLTDLLEYAEAVRTDEDSEDSDGDSDEDGTGIFLPRTAAKLQRMQNRLRRQGFTSFIE